MYLQHNEGNFLIIVLYFDDLFITGSTLALINFIKTSLHQAFDMNVLGLLKQFHGLEITKNFDGIMISQLK